MINDFNQHIYTEDLDYSQTGDISIWGQGDKDTLKVLEKLTKEKRITGYWLHFAAGDGRYNNLLLNEVDKLLATDIDKNALKKLCENTPEALAKKLLVKEQNIVEPFPFPKDTFDGAFNTGTLHLFPKDILLTIFSEISRTIKPKGFFIFDFATDIERKKQDGSSLERSKIEYSKAQAKDLLVELLIKNKFEFELLECIVPPEKVTSGEGTYTFSCNYWLVIAQNNL